MPASRGLVYASASASSNGLLVLSNDLWNATMSGVGAVPLVAEVAPYDRPHAVSVGRHVAVVSRLTQVLPEDLGGATVVVKDAELAAVEDHLVAFLRITDILAGAARPRPPAGAISFPLWGEVYYRAALIAGERKRFVVLSPSEWNRASGRAGLVRLTTQHKYPPKLFPPIFGGRAQSCPGEYATIGSARLLLRPQDRPQPASLPVPDLIETVRAFVRIYELEDALARMAP